MLLLCRIGVGCNIDFLLKKCLDKICDELYLYDRGSVSIIGELENMAIATVICGRRSR